MGKGTCDVQGSQPVRTEVRRGAGAILLSRGWSVPEGQAQPLRSGQAAGHRPRFTFCKGQPAAGVEPVSVEVGGLVQGCCQVQTVFVTVIWWNLVEATTQSMEYWRQGTSFELGLQSRGRCGLSTAEGSEEETESLPHIPEPPLVE